MLKYKNLKFKFVKYLVIFSVSMNLSSCQTDVSLVSKKIIGQWDISEFTYKNRNCLDDLLLNYIMFYNNNKIAIPEIYNYLAEDKENNSKWDIKIDTNKNVRVKLSCKNPIFNGDYKVTFFKNFEKRLLGIELKSKTTHVKAYKALQNFDYNKNTW